MADLRGFDANQVEPSAELEPMPAGKYKVVITESGMKPTKAGNGCYLQLTFQVIEGSFKNRLLWSRLNLNNPNAQAVEIARAELSAICRAVGVMAPNDSAELHNLPLVISVKCKRRDDTGDITNEIKGFSEGGVRASDRCGSGDEQHASLEAAIVINLELPYPPSINHYWRRVGPRTLISREGRRFRERVVATLAALRIRPLVGSLSVHVEIFPPDRRRRDIDNIQKALLDALQHGGAYADDSQIVRLTIEKREPVPGGKTLVRVRKAE